jgi:hypothetical protein
MEMFARSSMVSIETATYSYFSTTMRKYFFTASS